MTGRDDVARADETPARSTARGRLVFFGLVLLLFGLPLALATIVASLQSEIPALPLDEYAGGSLHGFVHDPDGAPLADVPVDAFLIERSAEPTASESEREPVASARTDAEGVFALELPPVDGCYELVAGGEGRMRRSRPVGLPSDPVELVLARGGRVRVEFLERGVPRGSGHYTLLSQDEGWRRFLLRPQRVEGAFTEGILVRDGLAAGEWLLEARLDDGVQHVLRVLSDPDSGELTYQVER